MIKLKVIKNSLLAKSALITRALHCANCTKPHENRKCTIFSKSLVFVIYL